MHVFLRNSIVLLCIGLFSQGCAQLEKAETPPATVETNKLAPSSLVKTAKPGEYLKTVLQQRNDLKNTLVVLDLDDTVIAPPAGQWLGSSALFYELVNKEYAKNTSSENKGDAASAVEPLYRAIMRHTPFILTDTSFPEVIDQYKQHGATIIGMTARSSAQRAVTLEQLRKLNIHFSDISLSGNILVDPQRAMLFRDGVVMVSHYITKGEALKALIDRQALPSNYHHLIMIDDKQEHLETVGQVVKNSSTGNTEYTPVLCTFPQTLPPYDSKVATQQLEAFLANPQNRKSTTTLIQQDPFTRKLLMQRILTKKNGAHDI